MKESDFGTIRIKSPYMVPVEWCQEKLPYAVFYKRGKAKALIADYLTLQMMSSGYPNRAFADLWKGIISDWTLTGQFNDFRYPLYIDNNFKYEDPETFFNNWLWESNPKPMFILHPGKKVPSQGSFLYGLAEVMGFEFLPDYPISSCKSSRQPISGLRLKLPEDSVMLSEAMKIEALTISFDYANKFILDFKARDYRDPVQAQLMKDPTWPNNFYNILKRGNYYMMNNGPTPTRPYDYTTGQYNEVAYKRYLDLALSDGVNTLTSWYLSEFFGDGGGFSTYWRLRYPSFYTLETTLSEGFNEFQPLGISAGMNKMDYEILEGGDGIELIIGALTEDLDRENPVKRTPYAHQRTLLGRKGSVTTLLGGPLSIRSFGKPAKIKFTWVSMTPIISLVDPDTFTTWNSGVFMNSRLRWSELYCYEVYLTMQNSFWAKNTAENIAKICKIYDSVTVSLLNYFGVRAGTKVDRVHFLFDLHPKGEKAHVFEEIIILDAADQTEIYEAAQTFGTTSFNMDFVELLIQRLQIPSIKLDNVPIGKIIFEILYKQNWLNCTITTCNLHETLNKKDELASYIKGETEIIDNEIPLVNYIYQLQQNFGIHIAGNMLHFSGEIRVLTQDLGYLIYIISEVTKMNIVPSLYFYRIAGMSDEKYKEYYQLLSNLEVYEPHGYLSDDTNSKWEETKTFFGFTSSVKPSLTVDPDYTPIDQFENPRPMPFKVNKV